MHKIIFKHHSEDFEVFDFRDKVNVAAYSLFSSSKYWIDLICCLSKQSKIDFIWPFSDLYARFIETFLVLKEAIYSKLLNFMQSHFFIILLFFFLTKRHLTPSFPPVIST